MTSAQVVETSVKVTTNSSSQDYTHPDDHNLRTYFSLRDETKQFLELQASSHFQYVTLTAFQAILTARVDRYFSGKFASLSFPKLFINDNNKNRILCYSNG